MSGEAFQPISVKPPSAGRLGFALRCLVDLQLATIVRPLRPAMACLPAGEIIDVGAGQSPWREWLPQSCRYVGLDIENANDFGMREAGDIHLYDGQVMPFADERFAGALCIEVLEHAADPDRLLAEVARVLKTGSPLLLTVPWSARRHHVPYDFHRFTKERLYQLLTRHGFAQVDIHERGDDVAVIANKLIVLTIRSIKRINLINVLVLLPAAALFALMSAIMLALAHLPRGWGLGSDADPLGYFCHAVKSPGDREAATAADIAHRP